MLIQATYVMRFNISQQVASDLYPKKAHLDQSCSTMTETTSKKPAKSDRAQKADKKDVYHHGDLRHALIQESYGLIRDHGAAQFTASDACRAIGVTSAALYRHFDGREGLMKAVAMAGFDQLTAMTTASKVHHVRGSVQAIGAGGCGYVQFAKEQPEIFRMMFGSSPNLRIDEEVHAHGLQCFGSLLEELAIRYRTQDEDEIRRYAFPLWTFVHGTAFLVIDEVFDHFAQGHDVDGMVRSAARSLLSPVPELDDQTP